MLTKLVSVAAISAVSAGNVDAGTSKGSGLPILTYGLANSTDIFVDTRSDAALKKDLSAAGLFIADKNLQNFRGICSTIASYLPSFCSLDASCLGIDCEPTLFTDTFDFFAKLHVCNQPMNIVIKASESSLGLNFEGKVVGSMAFGIPDLSVDIPEIGSAGVNGIVGIGGSRGSLKVALGLDACLSIAGYKKCYPNPPLKILSGVFDVSMISCSADTDDTPNIPTIAGDDNPPSFDDDKAYYLDNQSGRFTPINATAEQVQKAEEFLASQF